MGQIATDFARMLSCYADQLDLGPTREILHAPSLSVNRQRWVVARNPPMSIAFALAEVIWINGWSDELGFSNYVNKDCQIRGTRSIFIMGALRYRLRRNSTSTRWMVALIGPWQKNPDSRQIVLQIGMLRMICQP